MPDIFGLDLSHHDGENGAEIGQMTDAGASFLILKATEGSGYVDPAFDNNVNRARNHGQPIGAYHFLYGGDLSDAPRQMDHFLETLVRVGGSTDAFTWITLDAERPRGYPKLRWPFIRACARHLDDALPDHRNIGLYTSLGFWLSIGNPDATELFDWLWLAYYTLNHQLLHKWDTSSVSFRTNLGGFTQAAIVQPGPVVVGDLKNRDDYHDGDVFRGTLDELKVLGGKRRPRPAPTERTAFRRGNNDFLDAVKAVTDKLPSAIGPAGTPAAAGAANAKQALLDLIDTLKLADPAKDG